jgi:peptidoglycan/LPS O-acetylase OafA/YrhL
MTSPTKKDRVRPAELIALAAGFALFAGLVVLMSTRDIVLSLVFFGLAFIVVLIVLAMLTLAMRPTSAELLDIDEQNSTH